MNFFYLEEGEKIRYRVSVFWVSDTIDRCFFASRDKAQDFFNKSKAGGNLGRRIDRVTLYKEFGNGAILADWQKNK